jgi:hypothetical protein
MTKKDIVDYLTTDLKEIVNEDIKPCLLIGVPTLGGFFSVPRLVLTCVDYLGALYCGWKPTEMTNGRPNFTASWKAIKYIQDVLGQAYSEYGVRAKLLWAIYRHGTVHLNQPKVLQNGAKTIAWHIYKGQLSTGHQLIVSAVPTGIGTKVEMPIQHLFPMPIRGQSNDWILPISTTCLYQDLLESLDIYASMIQNETIATLGDNFRSAMNEMVKPEQTAMTWP